MNFQVDKDHIRVISQIVRMKQYVNGTPINARKREKSLTLVNK
ncbi:unnamed protein product [Paramecium sonneborni]|uniref:Uncharacterized protein n=1 Tax=Paramecium sonneborni TaxID=65129 RepID=A0A8S1RT80_9CILI|nr:unnamed protein product [Paramecium sonneborni]